MKKALLVFIFLFFSNYLTAQKYTDKDIVGKWKVVKVKSEINNPNLKEIINGFENAVFEFKENYNFRITTSSPSKTFSMLSAMANLSKWQLNANQYSIVVGDKSNGTIMKIIVFTVDDKTIFHLDESELNLEVQKE